VLKAHTRKKINDIEELRPTERARLSDDVVYGYFNCFFVFVGREKTKKRYSEGAGARDGGVMSGDAGAELEPGRGMAAAWLDRRCSWRPLVCFKSKYIITPCRRAAAAVIMYYFAPLPKCTGGGRGSGRDDGGRR
jgi:hypothetical protein